MGQWSTVSLSFESLVPVVCGRLSVILQLSIQTYSCLVIIITMILEQFVNEPAVERLMCG